MKRKKTQIIKKNINPAFQESFNFKADENDIETIGVRVTAMQHMPFPEKGRNTYTYFTFFERRKVFKYELMKKNIRPSYLTSKLV